MNNSLQLHTITYASLSKMFNDLHTYHNISYCRDNYNSLTSAKLPPKNEDGQLKSICADKRADKINI